MKKDQPAFLDRPAARLIALLVVIFCGGLLAFVHRGDLFSEGHSPVGDQAAGADADPAAPCITERFAEIDGMIEEGLVDSAQATLFKERALAMCRATTGDSGQASPLPSGVSEAL